MQSSGYESPLGLVILSDAKNLVATNYLAFVRTQRMHSTDEILHFVQNDKAERALLGPAIQLAKHSKALSGASGKFV